MVGILIHPSSAGTVQSFWLVQFFLIRPITDLELLTVGTYLLNGIKKYGPKLSILKTGRVRSSDKITARSHGQTRSPTAKHRHLKQTEIKGHSPSLPVETIQTFLPNLAAGLLQCKPLQWFHLSYLSLLNLITLWLRVEFGMINWQLFTRACRCKPES